MGIGKTVAIQGAGPIDLIEERLDLAERFGATDTVDAGGFDGGEALAAGVADRTPGGVGPDVVIESVGQLVASEQAIDIVRDAGIVVEVGHYADADESTINPTDLVQKEIDVRGSLAYPSNQFETSISLLNDARGLVPFTDLFNYEVEFNEAEATYEA